MVNNTIIYTTCEAGHMESSIFLSLSASCLYCCLKVTDRKPIFDVKGGFCIHCYVLLLKEDDGVMVKE